MPSTPVAGVKAEQCSEMHVSMLAWAVVLALKKNNGGQRRVLSVHDLVNLSCDYQLNTNKQMKKKGERCQCLSLTCSVCSYCPFLVANKMESYCLPYCLKNKHM